MYLTLHDLPLYLQDRYAIGYMRPVIDNTTIDWFALQGREGSEWTAIQSKRLLDTCDTMDVPIKVINKLHSNMSFSLSVSTFSSSLNNLS